MVPGLCTWRGQPLEPLTVSQARDTFGHLLVAFNRKDVARYTDGITHGFVIVRHLHDEATMRMRSKLPAAPAAEHGLAAAPAAEHRRAPLRGRSSKIQNNVVTMHRNTKDKQLPVLLELQPLARLRAVVEARLQLRIGAPPPAAVAQWAGLQDLYGKRVVPDSLCSFRAHWSIGRALPAAPGSP